MFRRRGPRVLGAVAVGGAAYAAGHSSANRAAAEQGQNQDIASLQAQQDALAQQQAALAQQQAAAAQPTAAPPPPVAAQPAAAAPSQADRITQLQQLGQLKEQGVLTDEEFAQEKQRILSGT